MVAPLWFSWSIIEILTLFSNLLFTGKLRFILNPNTPTHHGKKLYFLNISGLLLLFFSSDITLFDPVTHSFKLPFYFLPLSMTLTLIAMIILTKLLKL